MVKLIGRCMKWKLGVAASYFKFLGQLLKFICLNQIINMQLCQAFIALDLGF